MGYDYAIIKLMTILPKNEMESKAIWKQIRYYESKKEANHTGKPFYDKKIDKYILPDNYGYIDTKKYK